MNRPCEERGAPRRRVLAAALIMLGLAACRGSQGDRQVWLEEITASFAKARPDGRAWDTGLSSKPEIEGHLLVDGRALGSCEKRLLKSSLRCSLEVEVELTAESELRLIIQDNDGETSERMGEAVLLHAGAALVAPGSGDVTLKAEGSISDVKLRYTARHTQALDLARLIAVVLGALLALLLRNPLAPKWFIIVEGDDWNPAQLSAMLAIVLGVAITWPLARLDGLHPALISLPMLLGGYAATVAIVDCVVARRLGQRRFWLITAALGMAALVPLFNPIASLLGIAFVMAILASMFA